MKLPRQLGLGTVLRQRVMFAKTSSVTVTALLRHGSECLG